MQPFGVSPAMPGTVVDRPRSDRAGGARRGRARGGLAPNAPPVQETRQPDQQRASASLKDFERVLGSPIWRSMTIKRRTSNAELPTSNGGRFQQIERPTSNGGKVAHRPGCGFLRSTLDVRSWTFDVQIC